MSEAKTKRRKRSDMSLNDCLAAMELFAKRIQRMQETTDGGSFGTRNQNGISVLPRGQIVVQFLIDGGFGVGDDLFEAIRVLKGTKLPRKE